MTIEVTRIPRTEALLQVTTTELAELVQVPVATVRQWRTLGYGPPAHCAEAGTGACAGHLYDLRDVQDFLRTEIHRERGSA